MSRWRPDRRAALWLALVLASGAATLAFESVHLPAAFLMGSMLAAICFAVAEAELRVPPALFIAAQGVIGVMVATHLPLSVFARVGHDWPLFAFGTLAVVALANGLGLALARAKVLPGTTAIWGSAPGAATAMTLLSDSYGADMSLVAVMQYLRVLFCVVLSAFVARALGVHAPAPGVPVTTSIAWAPLTTTLALALPGAFLGVRTRVPGGGLLLPLVLGVLVQATGVVTLTLPRPLLVCAYFVAGWGIGLRFNKAILRTAARALPHIVGSILLLLALCAGLGFVLSRFGGVDPLTAYLATTPGGADTAAIIAVATKVDAPFVMAMQIARFLVVLLVGPVVARALSRRQIRLRPGHAGPASLDGEA